METAEPPAAQPWTEGVPRKVEDQARANLIDRNDCRSRR